MSQNKNIESATTSIFLTVRPKKNTPDASNAMRIGNDRQLPLCDHVHTGESRRAISLTHRHLI
jgi:hypothetical protein